MSISNMSYQPSPVLSVVAYYFLLHRRFENRDSKRQAIQTTVIIRLRPHTVWSLDWRMNDGITASSGGGILIFQSSVRLSNC